MVGGRHIYLKKKNKRDERREDTTTTKTLKNLDANQKVNYKISCYCNNGNKRGKKTQ